MNGNVEKNIKTEPQVCEDKNIDLDKNATNSRGNKIKVKENLNCKQIKSVIPKHRYLLIKNIN